MYNRKQLCLYHLFKARCEHIKGLLCPDKCNDKKVFQTQRESKLIPTNTKSMKTLLKKADMSTNLKFLSGNFVMIQL